MRVVGSLSAICVFVACTTQDVAPASRSAVFAEYPDSLLEAFAAACNDPGETLSRPDTTAIECRQLLPPEPTAYLILTYDGHTADLPQSVIRLTTTQIPDGYQIDTRMFLEVPQKTGSPLNVEVESSSLDRKLQRLYQATGGTPM